MHRFDRNWRAGVVVAVLAVTATAIGACSSDAPTTQLADDPADITAPGPRPTAPPESTGGLSASGNDLIAQLQALQEEDDLCSVIGGEAFATLGSGEVDLAALVTNPSGVAQLVAVVDATFAHVVAISPAEVEPSMKVISDVWNRLARLGGGADAQRRSQEILAEPAVLEADEAVLTWAALNCPGIAASALGGGGAG